MTRAREAAELCLLMREEEGSAPEEVMAEVRREFPEVTMLGLFRALSEMDVVRGSA